MYGPRTWPDLAVVARREASPFGLCEPRERFGANRGEPRSLAPRRPPDSALPASCRAFAIPRSSSEFRYVLRAAGETAAEVRSRRACARAYAVPVTLKSLLTKMWWGALVPILCTAYEPSLSCRTRLTVPPGYLATAAAVAVSAAAPVIIVP